MYEGNFPDWKEKKEQQRYYTTPLLKCHLCWEAPASVPPDCRNTHPNALTLTLHFPLFYSLIVSFTSGLNSLGRLRTQCLLLWGIHSGPLGVTVLQILDKGDHLLPGVCRDTLQPLYGRICGCGRLEFQSGINRTRNTFTANRRARFSNKLSREGKISWDFCPNEISRSLKKNSHSAHWVGIDRKLQMTPVVWLYN